MIGYESRNRFAPKSEPDAGWYYQQRRQRRQIREAGRQDDFDTVFSRDALYRAFDELKKTGGRAPGADGIRYEDVSPRAIGQIVGVLSESILAGTYRPHPTRPKSIPKVGGTRTLQIGSIFDRLVGRLLKSTLEPHWEERFLNGSWGFRPGRGAVQMLADLIGRMELHKRWALATDDIRKAFDNVRIADVLEAHRASGITDKRLMGLLEAVVRGSNPDRQIGIDQGSPFSPLALNAVLHFAHDVPLETDVNKSFWHRYADNLCYSCPNVTEGRQMLRQSHELLSRLGLSLKGDCEPADLAAGDSVQLLGFELHLDKDQVKLRPGDKALDNLREHLLTAHSEPNPAIAARSALHGWVESYGMTLVNGEHHQEILLIASELGFREVCSADDLTQWTEGSWRRWYILHDAAIERWRQSV